MSDSPTRARRGESLHARRDARHEPSAGGHCELSRLRHRHHGDVTGARSMRAISRINCFAILSAASAVAPLYLAPVLSWVVVQRTSPSGSTRRTEIRASLTVSVVAWLSSIPTD